MPNWCQNLMIVSGSEDEISKFEESNKTDESPLTFSAAVPRPASEEENWYDWNCENWGTKWDACNVGVNHDYEQGWVRDEEDIAISYSFETAWSPPAEWFGRMSAQWPDLKFILNYVELGCDFSGQLVSKKGAEVAKHYESLSLSDLLASGFSNHF